MFSVTEFTNNGVCDPRQTAEHQGRYATLPQTATTITLFQKAVWNEGDTEVVSSNMLMPGSHPWTFSFHGPRVPLRL